MLGNPVVIKEFDGHYPSKPSGQIPDNGFRQITNMFPTTQKTLECRRGFIRESGTTTYNLGTILGDWRTASGITKVVASHASGVSFFNWDNTSVSTPTATVAHLLLQFSNKAYLFRDATTNIRTWDDTTLTTTSVAVNANVGIVHKSRMFVANNASSGTSRSQLRYSEIMDATSPDTTGGWPSLNTIDIGSADADFITAVAVLNDTLFVFKRFSTWVVYVEGEPSWTVRQIHPNIGCIGRDTVVSIGGLLYFRSAVGVYRTDGSTFELISLPVKEIFDNQPAMAYTDCNARSAVWFGDYYWIFDGFGQTSHVYNIETGAWTRFVTTESGGYSRIFSMKDFSPPRATFLEYTTSGRLIKYEELNAFGDKDGTVTVTAEVISKVYHFDSPSNFKTIREIDFDVSQTTATSVTLTLFQYNESGIQAVYPTTSSVVAGTALRKLFRFRGSFKCRGYGFILQAAVGTHIELNEVIIDVKPGGRVGVAR